MEEKKLTDEEIVKALECCKKLCCDDETTGDCPLKRNERCSTILAINSLNLIHRLQSENKQLTAERSALYDNIIEICKRLAEQKAEIERLTERINDGVSACMECSEWYEKQVDELKEYSETTYKKSS